MAEEGFHSGFVALVGRPNVGKSTLLNAMLGRKLAIVSPHPQTTRNKILGVHTSETAQAIFLDTPGLHQPKHRLGQFMVQVVRRTLGEVDLILYVVDAAAPAGPQEAAVQEELARLRTPIFLVLNKLDLLSRQQLLEKAASWQGKLPFAELVPVSALSGENVTTLRRLVLEALPPGPRYYPEGTLTDRPEEFLISELIREQALLLTREEIPHSLAVVVQRLEERREDLLYVEAALFTERDSQKGILIGREGQMLRQIGILARQEIEALLGCRIYLDLRVRVRPHWRQTPAELQRMGYDSRQE